VAASDNRKVVVEDLIFIDDLEIIIYTTVRPQTSTIFISSMCKAQKNQTIEVDPKQAKVFELGQLDGDNLQDSFKKV
jgi:hypothetical protein